MSTYVEDLVQNIYTKCDMTGLDKLNQGLQDAIWYSGELHKNIADANKAQRMGFDFHARAIERSKEAYQIESLRNKLDYQQSNYRAKLAEQQQKWDEARQHRQEKYNKSLHKQNWLLRNAGRLIVGWFSFRAIKGMVDTASRIQLLRKSIEGLTKSGQDWEYIKKEAFEKAIDLETVAKGYRNFYSSAKMAGFDKGGIQQMYSDMLLSTRAIGATTQQTEGALLALEQMLSKGRVSMEELRRQLGNALPGAFEIGARAMKMSTKEFNEALQDKKGGGILSVEFVPKFIEQLKKEYSGGFEGIAQTMNFGMQRVSVAWKLFQTQVFEGEAGKSFASALDTIAKLLISPEFMQLAKVIGKIFEIVAKTLSFTIKHLHTILVLIGSAGIMAILPKIITSLKIIGTGLAFITSTGIINGIKILATSFWAMVSPMLVLYAKILLVISALLILEDLYTAIFHPEKKSLARREWQGENTEFGGSTTGNPFIRPKNVSQRELERQQNLDNFNSKQPMFVAPKSPKAGLLKHDNQLSMLGNGQFEKTTESQSNVTIGDIYINSNGNSPQEVANQVKDTLISLFMGEQNGVTV